MRAYDIILKKRNGEELSTAEIEFLITEYTAGKLPDYQLAAWTMAVFFTGLNKRETADLTMAMADSGEQVDLSSIQGVKVDKHSTGGVGDTTTLVLAPLVAAAGVSVAKMSGRGLGHTGGTIDKLEAIPSFNTALSLEEFITNVNHLQVAVAGQTGNLAPADKKLYALRDVTATVDSIPLISSSIMSKKIASGAEKIVLDVKVGSGAFMKTYNQAVKLAESMVEIGSEVGRETVAVISNMDQPLGRAVGNALEIREAVKTLRGEGPKDLIELCFTLGAQMLKAAGLIETEAEGKKRLEEVLNSGAALRKFKDFVVAQDGNTKAIDDLSLLPTAKQKVELKAQQKGYIKEIDAKEVGLAAMMLGAGRETKEDNIDLAVGIVLKAKVGDKVNPKDTLATLHINGDKNLAAVKQRLKKAYTITVKQPDKNKLIYKIIE